MQEHKDKLENYDRAKGPVSPNDDLKEVLGRGIDKIRQLEDECNQMRLRLQMFDDVISIFNAARGGSKMGYEHPNALHMMVKKLEALRCEKNNKPETVSFDPHQ